MDRVSEEALFYEEQGFTQWWIWAIIIGCDLLMIALSVPGKWSRPLTEPRACNVFFGFRTSTVS